MASHGILGAGSTCEQRSELPQLHHERLQGTRCRKVRRQDVRGHVDFPRHQHPYGHRVRDVWRRVRNALHTEEIRPGFVCQTEPALVRAFIQCRLQCNFGAYPNFIVLRRSRTRDFWLQNLIAVMDM